MTSCAQNPSAGVRSELLFKDGTTQPAAVVSAPIVIESALVVCASEGGGVRPTEDYTVGTSRRAVTAALAYLVGGSYSWWERLWDGSWWGRKGTYQLVSSVLKLSSSKRMWVLNVGFKQGGPSSL